MRRTLVPLVLLAGLIAPAAPADAAGSRSPIAVAASTSAEPATRPALAATLARCQTGAAPADRVAEFTGSMPALAGTRRMAMRFDLFERRGSATEFRRVVAPGLGEWERSAARRSGFIFTKRVESLAAPASYRATVRFRWYTAGGRIQRAAFRRTEICRQPDPRPQLLVLALEAAGGGLRATVANVGAGAAGPFATQLSVAGVPRAAEPVPGLAPGAIAAVTFAGVACPPGTPAQALADSTGAVAEADERDNALTVVCGP